MALVDNLEPSGLIFHESCLTTLANMAENSMHLVVTSPPYPGVDAFWGDLFKAENFDAAHEFLDCVWDGCLRVLVPGGKLAINIANTDRRPYLPNVSRVYQWARRSGIEPLGEIIWDKGYGQNGTAWGTYCNPADPALADRHEYILIFRKPGKREYRAGYYLHPRLFKSWRNSLWSIAPASATAENHIAPFPAEIPRRLILLYTYPQDIVYDPFVGSGTTVLAALETGRSGIGSEIDAEYASLARRNIAEWQLQPRLIAPYFAERGSHEVCPQQICMI